MWVTGPNSTMDRGGRQSLVQANGNCETGRCRIILFQGQKNEKCVVETDSERVHKYSPFWLSGSEKIGSAKQ